MPINRAAFSVLCSYLPSPSAQETDRRRADATMAFGGPALGPLCSSFIETTVGFRWNLRVMAIFNTVVSIAVAFVPESHGPTLLKWRIAKEGNAPPPLAFSKIIGVYKTALSRPIIYLFSGESPILLHLLKARLTRGCAEPTVTLVSIYLSVLYGILYGFFEAFGVVYLEIRGFSETSYGLTYIALGLGFVFGAFLLSTLGSEFDPFNLLGRS
jgi:DHA1 family multidrug resistance protein-like MFS transporter